MGAAYRSSTAANTGNVAATSLTITAPSGIAANDTIIACLSVYGGTSATITPPSGWAQISSKTQSTNLVTFVYWHLVTGYETSSYTWTFDSARQAAGILADYTGAYSFVPDISSDNQTGTPATTTATSAGNSTYETGLSIQVFGAYNTTTATTMTPSGGYTQRADTCTTTTPFVEVCIQDVSKGLGIGGMPANAATISSTATSTSINFYLEDQRPAFTSLAEDEFLIGNKTSAFTTSTSNVFAVNHPNELVLLFGCIANGTTTISNVTGGGLTWVNVGRANTNAGSTEVWRAFAPTPTTFTVTANMSASTNSYNYLVVGIVGADLSGSNGSGAIGAFQTAASTSAAPTVSLTTTRNNSWVWGAGNDPSNGTTTPVAGTNQTLLRSYKDSSNVCSSWIQRQNTITATSGTTVTINDSPPTADSCNILALEILPAVHHNLGALGTGN